MYEVNPGVAKINGSKGRYDDAVSNSSIKYGRNAVDNFYSYMENPIIRDNHATAPILDFSVNQEATDKNIEKLEEFTKKNDDYLNSLPPLEFEYRYMPNVINGQIDKQALLGASYEAMGGRNEISVKELNESYTLDDSYTYESLDINQDGKVDLAEYGTTFLAADMASKDGDPNKIDGTINNKGYNAVLNYARKSNAKAAAQLYSNLYTKFNLGNDIGGLN